LEIINKCLQPPKACWHEQSSTAHYSFNFPLSDTPVIVSQPQKDFNQIKCDL
jgi:hypothetical protein